MAEVLRSQTRNFLGSKVTRLQEHLVVSPDYVELINADVSSGSVVPIKADTLVDGSVQKSFCKYNDDWVSTDADAEYLEHNGKLYLTDGRIPKKIYSYLDVEYTEDLGINKPGTEDTATPFYYGSIHTHPYMDAWFFDPLVFGLRGTDTSSAGTDVDVYKYSDAGATLLQTYHFSTPHGTKLFVGVVDSSTVAVFVMGSAAIKWFKYSLAANTFTAQTNITLTGGDTFKSITGDHTTSQDGQWMSGAQSGSRWDSGWCLATSATQLTDGGNAWYNTANIYTKDTTNATSGDVDTPETPLKSLLAGFTIPTPPEGIENFYVSVRCAYSWASGTDWRWNTINRLQLYNGGWIGNNYAPVGIYQTQTGAFDGIISTGDFGVINGITRAMITDGTLKFGLNFQSGNNGDWSVNYVEIRVFGLIPSVGTGEDKFELFAGTTDGLKRYLFNSTTGITLVDTTYAGKTVHSCYWDYSNISVAYTDAGGTANPKMALLNSYTLGGALETVVSASVCEVPAMICHDPYNELYVAVDPDLSDSGDGEVVCYDNITTLELDRVELPDVGTTFPSGLCADDYRVYTSDLLGSYSYIKTYLNRTLESSGDISGVYDSANSGNCRSIRKCDSYIVAATGSADPNTFSGIWIYHKNSEVVPTISHYTPCRSNMNGVYSYGLTFYNEKDGTESEMLLFVSDAYVVNGLIELKNIPEPTDTQVTKKRIWRVGGALRSFSLITELDLGVTSYKDLIPDSEAGESISLLGRNKPPLDLRYITEVFGTFFGISGNYLYYTTQANANYWTLFPLDLGKAGTGLAVCGQGLIAFTATRSYFLSGTTSDTFQLYPLSRTQGCVNGKSIQEDIGGGVRWMSSDGLCFSNGGKPVVQSKEILGKIGFSGITSSALYDDVYFMSHADGVFIADFRYNNTIRFSDLSDTDIDGMGVFDDSLYFIRSAGLYGAFNATINRKVILKSGVDVSTDPLAVKYYKNIRVWYKGRPTIKVYLDGVQYGKSHVLDAATVVTTKEISLEDSPLARHIQYRITGDFELHYIEYVYDGNKKLS